MFDKSIRYIVQLNQWRKKHISQGAFLIIAAAIVGGLGGLAASVLKKLTHLLANYLQNDFHWQYKYYLYFFFPLIGISLTVFYVKLFIRKKKFRTSIPPIIHSITHERSRLDFHNAYSQIITSALTVGMGGSAGLESPAVFSGASMGSNFGRLFGLNYRETSLLLACGGAAGISGAFDGPIAGMLFAIEVLLPAFNLASVVPLLLASAVASVVSWMVYNRPLFVYVTDSWTKDGFWVYVVFGIVSGFYSVFYAAINEKMHQIFEGIRNDYKRMIYGGLAMGIMVAFLPALYGEGYITIQKLLDGNYNSLLENSFFSAYTGYFWILALFGALTLVGKTVACGVTLSCGGNGGMFGPSVGIGGLLGFVFGITLNYLGIAHVNVTHFIVAGMAASVSGVMHAPLTGVFLAAEITGGYVLMVPLMVVSAISYFINKRVRKYSIYTKGLAQKGELVNSENRDISVLTQMKLKYLIEKDFEILYSDESPNSRREDIIHTEKSIFPVVDRDGILKGVLTIEEILEYLVGEKIEAGDIPFEQIVQPFSDPILVNSKMKAVLQEMDKHNSRIFPVVDQENHYLGFVTKNRIFNRYRKLLVQQNDML